MFSLYPLVCEFFQLFNLTFTSIYLFRPGMCLETIVSLNPTLPLRNMTGIRGKRGISLWSLSAVPWWEENNLSCVLSLSPPCVDISVCLAGGCNILPSYWSSQAGLVTLLVCLAGLTGPVTGATLIKREITTFLASPPPTVVYLACSLNMELQPTLKIS